MKEFYELIAQQTQQEAFDSDPERLRSSLGMVQVGAALMDQGLEGLGIDREKLEQLVHKVFPGNGKIDTTSGNAIEGTSLIATAERADIEESTIPEQLQPNKFTFPTLQEIFPDFDPAKGPLPGQRRAMIQTESVRPDSSGQNLHHMLRTGKPMIDTVFFDNPNRGAYLAGSIANATSRDPRILSISQGGKPDSSTADVLRIIRRSYAPIYDGVSDQDLARLIRREIPFPAVHGLSPKTEVTAGDLKEGVAQEIKRRARQRSTVPKKIKIEEAASDPIEPGDEQNRRKVDTLIADFMKGQRSSVRKVDSRNASPAKPKPPILPGASPVTRRPSWVNEYIERQGDRLDPLEVRYLEAMLGRDSNGDHLVTTRVGLMRRLFGNGFGNLSDQERGEIEAGLRIVERTLRGKLVALLDPSNNSEYSLKAKAFFKGQSSKSVLTQLNRPLRRHGVNTAS